MGLPVLTEGAVMGIQPEAPKTFCLSAFACRFPIPGAHRQRARVAQRHITSSADVWLRPICAGSSRWRA